MLRLKQFLLILISFMLPWISKFHKPLYASYLLSLFYTIKRLLLWLTWSSFNFCASATTVAWVVIGLWRLFYTLFVQAWCLHYFCINDWGVWLLRHCCCGCLSKVERNLLVDRFRALPTSRLDPPRTHSRAHVRWMSLRDWHKCILGLISTMINGVRGGGLITGSSEDRLALKSDTRALFFSNWRLKLPVVIADFILVEDWERIQSLLTFICIFITKASPTLVLQAAQIEIFRHFAVFLTLGSLLSFCLASPLLFFHLLAFLENLMEFGLSLSIHLFSEHAQGLDHVFEFQEHRALYIGKFFIREVYVEGKVYSFLLFFLEISDCRSLRWVCMVHKNTTLHWRESLWSVSLRLTLFVSIGLLV